jgi:hypothetical protein
LVCHDWQLAELVAVILGYVEPIEHFNLHAEVTNLAEFIIARALTLSQPLCPPLLLELFGVRNQPLCNLILLDEIGTQIVSLGTWLQEHPSVLHPMKLGLDLPVEVCS